ncbi:MAG: nitrous oxide reductase accessory protein NosL [Candidatus Thiodiazotropha taylori]|nr:nitrous oxide reductase accessory protein NosL [Candidatus Thiodiazotropha endolucinida]MCW4228069.1 nitrous oxide reductase accessory protein NosL [Candidatus Thiodiazotropha taylori]
MSEASNKERRNLLKLLSAAGLTGLAGGALAGQGVGVMVPGKGWVEATGASCDGDGTPLQFIPKRAADATPLENELEKYAKCPYCGMDRTKWHHSRHLIHYDDDLVDATCSIHCLAISLSLNIDRGPKAIYAADFGAEGEIKPLVNVDQASYLIGAKLKGTMTTQSKMAFASADQAKAIQAEKGGTLANFDEALSEAYAGMAKDTVMVRKKRAERRKKMMQKMKQQKG